MKLLSLSPTIVPRSKRTKTRSEEALNPSFADLPLCLVEVIMSRLVLKDNIRASAACKSWREAALSVRVVEKHPWLLCFLESGSLIKLQDPLECKSYTLDLPELAESTVCYSRDSWLLMQRSSSNDIFFFNPFSRELISLPKFELSFQTTSSSSIPCAFSCPPTSDSCVVMALKFGMDFVTVSTWHLGAAEWISDDFATDDYKPFCRQYKLVYQNDQFYCFNGVDRLHSFHPSSRRWNLHYFHPSSRTWNLQRNRYKKAVFLAEKEGELFLMFTSGNEKPMVYKLASLKWEEMTSTELDGLTIFASVHNSELRCNVPWMRNNIYFSRYGYNRKRCVYYSFDENRYDSCKEWHNWSELCPPQCLWIDPPNNVLDYL